jgi:putative N6-adenine-specific DNA methylase
MKWYAVAHPGLEGVVAAEIAEAGPVPVVSPGGVAFDATLELGARLARSLRTPDRLLAELASGPAPTSDQLAALVRKADWRPFIHPLATLEVAVTTRASRVHYRDSAERKVEHAVREALKGPRLPDKGGRPRMPQRVQVRIDADRATISVDAGGELLHRRGWRPEGGGAPLRENLAAALLRLAGWHGTEPFVDPFCGSGTLPIEAALLAAGRSPFGGRPFACDEWPGLGPQRREPPRQRSASVVIVGADRDAKALPRALANAERARVDVRWQQIDVSELAPPAPSGTIVTNPPWGLRLAPEAVGSVYARFGRAIRERFGGWRVVFLSPHPSLAERVHREATCLTTFTSGGVHIGVWAVEPGVDR